MAGTSRFECVSSSLTLKALLRNTRRVLWISLGLGLGTHLSLTQIGGLESEQQAAKPLTTQFIKRQPRLTKPLELKKRPQPRQRRVQREMISVKAKVELGQRAAGIQAADVVRGLARPNVRIGRTAALGVAAIEPEALAGIIRGTKEAGQRIDTGLELLDIDALDTGQYHAMVILDPADKRNIRGFIHLAVVYSETIDAREREVYYRIWGEGSQFYRRVLGLNNLVGALNQHTDIRADIWPRYSFSSRELFKTPWVLVSTFTSFKLAQNEAHNIGQYLTSGGFVLADNFWFSYIPGYVPLKRMFEDVLATQGWVFEKDWAFEKLPNDHPVYHCYFDFDGAPVGLDVKVLHNGPNIDNEFFSYLEGIPVEGRLAGILSNKAYLTAWSDWDIWPGDKTNAAPRPRALQFGVNLVIFALTQEGSITHQLMESLQ